MYNSIKNHTRRNMVRNYFTVFLLISISAIFAWDSDGLFPLSVGNAWEMREIDYGYGDTTYFTQEIVGTTELFGHLTHLMVENDDTSYIQNREDGLFFVVELEGMGGFIDMMLAPESFDIGDSWEMLVLDTIMDYGSDYEVDFFMRNTLRAVTTENVTVPAGNFGNCIMLEQTYFQVTIVMMGDAIVSADTSTGTDTNFWIKPGIGFVKIENMPETDSVSVEELVSYMGDGFKESAIPTPEDLTLQIAPNPFNSKVDINTSSGAKVSIIDQSGRILDTFIASSSQTWSPDNDLPTTTITIKSEKDGKTAISKAVYVK